MYTYIRTEVCLLWQAKKEPRLPLLPSFLMSICLSSVFLLLQWLSKKHRKQCP